MTTARRRTWWQVVIAGLVVLGIATIALVGGTTLYIYRHIRSDLVPADAAAERMAAAKARFGASPAFLRVDAHGRAVVNGREGGGAHQRLATLRALAYDPASGKLVDISVPFWLLRLVPNGRISLDGASGLDISAERLNLNVSALEDLGPGLVIDQEDRGGRKVLVWTE
jgi:hypothetical protein